ncbi:MAG: hypothetical protein ABI904_00380 [Chloroflexota bacterium]
MPLSNQSAYVGEFALEAGVFLFITYVIFIFWFAQFILPVASLEQRLQAAWRLFIYSISWGHWHGPAIFVQHGKNSDPLDEREKTKPGVAFIDLRSAVTIDHFRGKEVEETGDPSIKPQIVHFLPFSNKGYSARIRVAGPGLTFTKKNEKITGVVDLRNQSRTRKDVFADTRDGIRIKTNISCSFTVGQPPEVLDVWLGGVNSDQVFVVEWETPNIEPLIIKKLIPNELALEDEKEIWEFAHNNPDPITEPTDVPAAQFPFTFDSNRVKNAIYTETHLNDPSNNPNLLKKWLDWPQDVAAEKFRLLLSKQPYMNLYAPEKQETDAMKLFKRALLVQVRNMGVLAYRLIKHRNGQALEVGKTYQKPDLIIYPAHNLTRSDVLRDRGIKVLTAGFSELVPQDETVRQRLTEAWLSAKKREAAIKFADYNLEATRIKNHARVRTQQNMIYHLTQLLENQEYPREALAMLIYQELEAAAANPETRRLLPEQTLNLITGIGEWLLPHPKNEKPDEPPSLHLDENH